MNSLTLNCNFKYLKDLDEPETREIYACESINFTNFEKKEPINYVTNLHEIGRQNRDVKVFIIKHQTCHYLPAKIENFFAFVQEIEVDSSNLKQLFRENFARLPELKMAIFPNNELEFLPDDLFIYNFKLTHLDFSQNQIKNVGINFFKSLHKLRYLLFDNDCYVGYAYVFEEVQVLKEEILSNCSFNAKPEKRIVVKVEQVKVEDKKPHITEKEKPKEEPKLMIQEPKGVKGGSSSNKISFLFSMMCFLHAFVNWLRETNITFWLNWFLYSSFLLWIS